MTCKSLSKRGVGVISYINEIIIVKSIDYLILCV